MARFIDCQNETGRDLYRLLIGLIGPRPIGWISSISAKGVPNLAPYSFFNMLSMNPAMLGFCPALTAESKEKDTLRNIKETKCFVHNVVTEELAVSMNDTSAELPPDESEFEVFGLTPIESQFIKAPRVKESPVQIECELFKIISLGDQPGNGQLVIGKIRAIHVSDESVLEADFKVNPQKLKLLSRLGGLNYMRAGEIFSLPR